ncbi:MAG: sulfatase, partial [Caldilineaceae bacterium]|nr:sulfatase [Caldilineaceae bacterium]
MQNVLFVICHDFGPRMGCYGDSQAVTPNLDRLAADGSLRFERHYAQWPLCGPSRANLWTGCRPPTTRRYDNRSFFPEFRARMGPAFATLPEHFRNHGYAVHGVWQLLHGFERDDPSWDDPCWLPTLPTPETPAFVPRDQLDHFYWWVADGSFALVKERMDRWQAAGHALDEPRRYRGPAVEAADVSDNAYVDGAATDQAVSWIEQYDGRRPFFLGAGYEIGHLPFCAPKRYWDLYNREELSIPGAADQPAGSPPWVIGDKEPAQYYWQHSYDRPWHPTYAQEKELLHGHYAAMSYWDAQVGRLIDALERRGLKEDTIVVVTTDHGFSDGQHGYWGKHNLWAAALHVPLIVRVPGRTPARTATPRLSEHVDLFPTLCDLCGLPQPTYLEGTSLAPLWADPMRPWKGAAFAWRRPMYHDLHQAYHQARSMFTERYHLTVYEDDQ